MAGWTERAEALWLWAEATGYAQFLRRGEAAPRCVPALVQLAPGCTAAQLHAELRAVGGSVPPGYHPSLLQHCTAWLPRSAPDALVRLVERVELQLPVLPLRPRPSPAATAPPARHARPRSARSLLVGVIDSACAFAHQRLRDASGAGTRVLHLWDQDGGTPAPAQPGAFGYGREFARAELDALMAGARRGGALDEAACYAAAGLPALRARDVHGVAVLDLLAGRWTLTDRCEPAPGRPPRWPGMARDPAGAADIVAVQLPRDVVQDSSSAALARHLLDGVHYILACAGPRTEHVVINISDGSSRGPHDGSSMIEQAFAELVEAQAALGRRLDLVLPVGNHAQEQRHARCDGLAPQAPLTLRLRVPPDSEAANWVVLHLPQAEGVTVTLRAPGHGDLLRASAGEVRLGARAGIAFAAPLSDWPGALVCIAPTPAGVGGGDWVLGVETTRRIAGPIDAHIARNATNLGALRRGLQAHFVDAAYDGWRFMREAREDAEPLSPIRRDGAVNGLATGGGVWVAGGADRRSGEPTAYSSRAASRGLPLVGLPADESQAAPGLRMAGALSGQTTRMRGTSFSAPQLARHLCRAEPPQPRPAPRQRWRQRGRPGSPQTPDVRVLDVED
jgi:hypothetical protein